MLFSNQSFVLKSEVFESKQELKQESNNNNNDIKEDEERGKRSE